MRRWRFIKYFMVALVLSGAPARLNAQEPAKKDTPPGAAPAAAAEKAQPPASAPAKQAGAAPGAACAGRGRCYAPARPTSSSISHFSVKRLIPRSSRSHSGSCC